jgi:hypothetical protein
MKIHCSSVSQAKHEASISKQIVSDFNFAKPIEIICVFCLNSYFNVEDKYDKICGFFRLPTH